MSRKGARWFTAQVSSKPSSVRRRELLTPPALLASTSILGCLARISAASLRIDACELRSAKRTSTSVWAPPAALICSTAAAALDSLRATIESCAPRWASSRAAARPIPPVAPVMITRLPATPVHSCMTASQVSDRLP